jgi:hypothetical protein
MAEGGTEEEEEEGMVAAAAAAAAAVWVSWDERMSMEWMRDTMLELDQIVIQPMSLTIHTHLLQLEEEEEKWW